MFLKSGVSLKQEIKCDRIIDFIRILYTVKLIYYNNQEYPNTITNKEEILKILKK